MDSSNNDNQASFGSKRPRRNDVIQKDGDWICTTCGNLNFAFRIACNRKSCNAPKPSGTPAPKPFVAETLKSPEAPIPAPKPIIAPVKALATEIMSSYNGGVATPPPPPPALPMYGMPINFGSIPSCIPYGSYGTMPRRSFGPKSSIQAGTIGPATSIPPESFGAIPSIPSGGIGGPSPWGAGLTTESNKNSESHNDSRSNKRRIEGPDGVSVGDWVCPNCENVNFAFRTKCNMKKCRVPRPSPVPVPVFPEGSWSCRKCGNMNYPYRNTCNMKGCRVERTASDN